MVQSALKYRDKVSQLISWGHWFCLGNIFVALLIAIRYLYIAHWPDTLLGQGYMFISWFGQFSFLPFVVFLLTLFPLSFLLPSNRSMRFLGALIATLGISALAIDTQVFSSFNVHLNPMLWQLLIDKENNRQSTDVNLIFILVPLIFFMELLLARLCWVSLRNLERRRIGKPIAIGFFVCFFLTHIVHVWADATIYRPITSQKINYPLFYPMTARNLLNSYGLIDVNRLRQRSQQAGLQNGNPLSYPEHPLSYQQINKPRNILLVVIEGLRYDSLSKAIMPNTYQLSQNSLNYTQHFSGGNDHELGLFSLFYGLPTSYWATIEHARIHPVLFDAIEKNNYKIQLFSSNGFPNSDLNKTIWGDLSTAQRTVPEHIGGVVGDKEAITQWRHWQENSASADQPWFNYINLSGVITLDHAGHIKTKSVRDTQQWHKIYNHAAHIADQRIGEIIDTLKTNHQFANTILIITSDHGQEFGDGKSGHWGYGNNLSKYQTQVPLVIHWPNKLPREINYLTSHFDIAPTLAQNELGVTNRLSHYSTGQDLLALDRHPNWILVGSKSEQAIYQPHKIILFNDHGDYEVRNRNYHKISKRADMPVILQVLNELKRFYQEP